MDFLSRSETNKWPKFPPKHFLLYIKEPGTMYESMPELCTTIPLPHLSQFYLLLLFLIPTEGQVKSAWEQSHW